MKNIFIKIALILFMGIFLFYLFYSPSLKFDVLENPIKETRTTDKIEDNQNNNAHKLPQLKEGPGTYIGKNIDMFTKKFGYPKRIYDSNHSYRNFVYEYKDQYYIAGVKNDRIVMLYTTGIKTDARPFKIGDSAEHIFKGKNIVYEPVIKTKNGKYQFTLQENDIKTQLLIEYNGVFVQVFIDRITNKIMAVRFVEPETLVEMQPYEMSYNGKMIQKNEKSDDHKIEEVAINSNKVLTMFELTNYMREINGRKQIDTNELINHVAQIQVAKLKSSEGEKKVVENGEIEDQLKSENITYNKFGLNTAYNFTDVPTLVNSWMNTDDYRDRMLNRNFNEMGGGISGAYYSLIFIENNDIKEK